MLSRSVIALAIAGATAEHGLNLDVSLKGVPVELSKAEQHAEWHDLKDEAYNSKGFYSWKPQAEGFILKNKDSNQLSCHVQKSKAVNELNAQVSFDCGLMEEHGEKDVVLAAMSATARFRSKLKNKFTPVMKNKLTAIDPVEQLAKEAERVAGRRGIDDDIPSYTDTRDQRAANSFMDQIDLGNNMDPIANASPFMQEYDDNESDADMSIEMEANHRLYNFFLNHPQYSTSEALYSAAKQALDQAAQNARDAHHDKLAEEIFGEANIPGQVKPSKLSHDEQIAANEAIYERDGHGKQTPAALWKTNQCILDEHLGNVNGPYIGGHPKGDAWIDEHTGCHSYAVGPMGYWGCQWLFEDGTCGYIRFYPAVRWDGLDSYRTGPLTHKTVPASE